jgi:acyl-CoA synthetase (AMP-forming)/AMP-acid ligase II
MHTFVHALRRAERVALGREALVCGDVRLTYAELLGRCRRLAGGLDALGTARGDRVAVLSFNSIPFVELYCTLSAAGRVQVPLNFRWSEPELAYALEDAGARVLFIDREPGQLGALVDRVVRTDTAEYEALLAAADEVDLLARTPAEDDLAGLFYTGGTTGASKGVMLTHRNLLANTFNSQMLTPMDGSDVYLVMAPLFHAAGSISLLQSIYVGALQVILPAFDPAGALDVIEAEGVTATLGVPTMVAGMVEEQLARPRRVDTLRTFAHGGSPIATEVVRRAAKAFPGTEFVHVYGATETAPLVTGLRHEEGLIDSDSDAGRGRSAGQPVVGVEVVIRSPDGAALPDGEAGEVTVQGTNVMVGYWNKAEQSAAVMRDGWYWTGDVGRLDEEGFLYLLDRSKDMIISGGENVYCTEVEEALYAHPLVLEATVFGIPDERWGEAVHAVVVPRGAVEPDELIAHCRGLIAGYKVPRSLQLREEPLPKSGPGKVLKRELRAPFWEGRDTQIS